MIRIPLKRQGSKPPTARIIAPHTNEVVDLFMNFYADHGTVPTQADRRPRRR